ncbi:MAG: biotin-dependent carboxyltransferase family protein [Litorimonas sp.]
MITILNGGTRTTIQDMGRAGHRHTGIPTSGAADRLSFAIANFLAGNTWNTPALECTLGGLHLRFETPAIIAVSGAEMWGQINGQNFPMNRALHVETGDILTLSYARAGCRAYIAIAGGIEADMFLGSASTYIPAGLGGFRGRAVKSGDQIPIKTPAAFGPQVLPNGYGPKFSKHIILRVRPAPEWDRVSAVGKRFLFTSPFYATQATDRMGARLKGDNIKLDDTRPMVSGPLIPGCVQITPNGEPILTGIDGHCTGGYVRAIQVIQADIWLLGQIAPGSAISFRRCFAENTPKILAARQAYYSGLIPNFRF